MEHDDLLVELLEKQPPVVAVQCHMKQDTLRELFAASEYGGVRRLFLAYFDPDSQPPLCCICHRPIGAHPSEEAATTSRPVSSGDAAATTVTAVATAELLPSLGTVAGTDNEAFVLPPIPPADNPQLFKHVAPPDHWCPGAWAKSLVEVHSANADGIKWRCKMPVPDPSDPNTLRPCGAVIEKSQSAHLAFQHQIIEPPAPFNKGRKPDLKGRPWQAPFFPETKDCGVLCDCLLCPCCFCNRIYGSLTPDSRLGTYWVKVAAEEDPRVDCQGGRTTCLGDAGGYCLCCCMWWFLGLGCLLGWSDLSWFNARERLVALEAIEDPCGCCFTLTCAPCALVQMHRELRALGLNPGTSCCSVDPSTIRESVMPPPPLAAILAVNPEAERRLNQRMA